jgi:hypothetical protein
MSTDRYYATATLLANGKVLIAGGYDNGTNPVSSAELYEPSSSTFSPTGSMSTARDAATATLLANGKVLIAGGGDNAAELYGPASGTFSPTGSMSTDRYYATATLLANGKVLIAGGYNGNNGTNSVSSAELYDPASGTFSPTGSMSTPRDDATATLLANGKVLIAGGYYNIYPGYNPVSSAELYDPASGTFSPTGSMSKARDDATATLLANGKVLIAGGGDVSAELYSP